MKAGLAIHGIVLGETLAEAKVQFRKYHMIETELDRLGSCNAYIRLALRDDQAQQTPGLIVTFKNEHVVHLEGDDIENNLPAVGRQLATINPRARGAPTSFGEPLEEHYGVYTYRIVGFDRIIARLLFSYDRHNLARRGLGRPTRSNETASSASQSRHAILAWPCFNRF